MVSVNWSNFTDFGDLPSLANTTSNGTFWAGMLYMMWIILIMMLSFYGFELAILVASFLGLIIAILLVYADLIAWYHALVFVGTILFMFLYIIYSGLKVKQ